MNQDFSMLLFNVLEASALNHIPRRCTGLCQKWTLKYLTRYYMMKEN